MLEVEFDATETLAFLKNIDKQMRYGTQRALNDLILRFQRVQRIHQRKVFKFSGSSGERYWKYGVKIPRPGGFATRDKPFEARSVWLPLSRKGGPPKYDIFERQQFGGTRVPVGGRKKLAIPDESIPRTGGGQIQARKKPSRMKRAFFVPFKSGMVGMFERTSPRSKKYVASYSHRALGGGKKLTLRQDPNVEFRYLLIPKGEVDAVYDYYENAKRVWTMHANRVLRLELAKAFRTARVGGGTRG